jgi:tetratricopeptide (TPR) repeat protein
MQRLNTTRFFDAIGPLQRVYQGHFVCAVALLCALAGGCVSEQHVRVQQFTDEGVFLFRQGDYSSALEHFEFAKTLGPPDANLLFNIGHCNDRLGNLDKAETAYRQCLQATANHAECRHALELLLYRTNRRPEADDMIQLWLASEPKIGAAYAEDGWRMRLCGDLNHARGRFQQALHYDPRNVRALVELGMMSEEEQRPDVALTLYGRALEYDPQNPELKAKIDRLRANGVGKALPD